MQRAELADFLRRRRAAIHPAEVGIADGPRRRTTGLRREEVALLAGMSVDYVVRLEQGRSSQPSTQLLAALARALRLTEDERDHLYRLGRQPVPATGKICRHVTPGVQRLLDRLAGVPVAVFDAGWHLVAWNRLWTALLGDPTELPARERNVLWSCFVGPASRVRHTPQQQVDFETALVADLRTATGRHPAEASLQALVAALRSNSARFAELWDAGVVGEHGEAHKTVEHPQVGAIALDCDVLTVAGSQLRIVTYTAAPGSPDAEALALLGVVGTQSLDH